MFENDGDVIVNQYRYKRIPGGLLFDDKSGLRFRLLTDEHELSSVHGVILRADMPDLCEMGKWRRVQKGETC